MHSPNTILTDRVLWYDGISSFKAHDLINCINKYNVRFVDVLTPEIEQYNRLVTPENAIVIKDGCGEVSTEWNIPEPYKSLDVEEYLFEKHKYIEEHDPQQTTDRRSRLAMELKKYDQKNLFDALRAIIYVINTLNYHKIVWGVGRGSSVSSYVLYVIGVHDVDSFSYNLDIDDFLHDQEST